MVLAENALQVAVSKKQVADAFRSRNGRLFAFVDANRSYFGFGWSMAKSRCHASVGAAATRTYMACTEIQMMLFYNFCKDTKKK